MSNNIRIQRNKKGFSIKGKQGLLLYDTDFSTQVLIRQRLYYLPGNPDVFTPVTRSIAERLRPLNPKLGIPKKLPFSPRECTACFDNPEVERGYSEYSVFIPYTPKDPRFRTALREIMALEGVSAIRYSGESREETKRV